MSPFSEMRSRKSEREFGWGSMRIHHTVDGAVFSVSYLWCWVRVSVYWGQDRRIPDASDAAGSTRISRRRSRPDAILPGLRSGHFRSIHTWSTQCALSCIVHSFALWKNFSFVFCLTIDEFSKTFLKYHLLLEKIISILSTTFLYQLLSALHFQIFGWEFMRVQFVFISCKITFKIRVGIYHSPKSLKNALVSKNCPEDFCDHTPLSVPT